MEKIRPITWKVNAIIVLSLVVGIGAVIVFLALRTNGDLEDTTLSNLELQSEVIFQAVKNAMLFGEAPLAVEVIQDVAGINPAYDIRLYRTTGAAAFSDNSTIRQVNTRLAAGTFKERQTPPGNSDGLMVDEKFTAAVEQARRLWVRQLVDGRDSYCHLQPADQQPELRFVSRTGSYGSRSDSDPL